LVARNLPVSMSPDLEHVDIAVQVSTPAATSSRTFRATFPQSITSAVIGGPSEDDGGVAVPDDPVLAVPSHRP
jgi:hypothetical protein